MCFDPPVFALEDETVKYFHIYADWPSGLESSFCSSKKGKKNLTLSKLVKTENCKGEFKPTQIPENSLSLTTALVAQRVALSELEAPQVFKERLAIRATQAKSAPRDSRDSRLVQPCVYCVQEPDWLWIHICMEKTQWLSAASKVPLLAQRSRYSY